MSGRKGEREVVYVAHSEDATAKWLFFGVLLGAGLALLYAPRSGEETRRSLQRSLWKLRALTEEKIDELAEQFGNGAPRFEQAAGLEEEEVTGEYDISDEPRAGSPRQELERRLAETRARRREQTELEEPLA